MPGERRTEGAKAVSRRDRRAYRPLEIARRVALVLFGVTILAGLLVSFTYAKAVNGKSWAEDFSLLVMFGAAALVAGQALGFLFAVPRSRRIDIGDHTGEVVEETVTVTPKTTLPNTNLEQISDWLTKIIVGVTLTQIGHIPAAAGRLFNELAGALGTSTSGQAFVGGLVIFTFTFGFMLGWVTTRAWIGLLLTAVDDEAAGNGQERTELRPAS